MHDGPTFLSLFSGIGGLDLGLERAGWRCVGQVEIDPYRRGILERWWPDVPKAEDVREVTEGSLARGLRAVGGSRPDQHAERARRHGTTDAHPGLICGGFPCQDLSVAGKRAGLKGARSSLFFEFARIADAVCPTWLLVENVPGLLSSHGGRDFAVVLATLADLGYGVAWRVLDSRYFGVPQRRRRVFVVGHLGVEGPEPFLPFLEGGEGNPAEGRTTGKGVAGAVAGRSPSRLDDQGTRQLVSGYTSSGAGWWDEEDFVRLRAQEGGTPQNVVAYSTAPAVQYDSAVRRLTPVECCRLQGFPDDWLGGNEPPDSPKYAALGDAVTVPVAEWIGERLRAAGLSRRSA